MTNLNDTTLSFSDDELKEIEQKLESEDPTFRFKFLSEKDVSFFLAAQKKRPQSFIWVDLINMYYAGDRYKVRKLKDEPERKKILENALQYLLKSKEMIQNAKITEKNKQEYYFNINQLDEEIAVTSLEIGELETAKQMAKEMLINNVDTLSFNYGNIIHHANTILGRVALRENNLKQAKEYLIKSIEGPASPQLSSFGPSYILAKELLEHGEKDIVLDYLDLVPNLWAKPKDINSSDTRATAGYQRKSEMLKKWKEEIKSGKIPDNPRWR